MSYDYELKEENKRTLLNFDKWYDVNSVELQEEYIDSSPEDFRTDEDMQNIESNGSFQSFCECKYDKYYDGLISENEKEGIYFYSQIGDYTN